MKVLLYNLCSYLSMLTVLLGLLFFSSCYLDKIINQYIDYKGIHNNPKTEAIFSDNNDVNSKNYDNRIYISKRQFIFSYYYINDEKKHFKVQRYIGQPNFFLGRLVPFNIKNDSTSVDKIGLYVYQGHNSKEGTTIKYDYYNDYKKQTFSREKTWVDEGKSGIFLHPFRQLSFSVNYLYVYPQINFPLKMGEQWKLTLDIFEETNQIIKEHYRKESLIPNFLNHHSKIVSIEKVELPFKKLKCYKVETVAEDDITNYKGRMDYYFNEDYGFVKFFYYDAFNGCDLVVELEDVIDYK
ncbi:MAG: hypothetical protein AB8G11_03470 [Saprospiraceae bacterium]